MIDAVLLGFLGTTAHDCGLQDELHQLKVATCCVAAAQAAKGVSWGCKKLAGLGTGLPPRTLPDR
jgi:hypothetical protein